MRFYDRFIDGLSFSLVQNRINGLAKPIIMLF